LKYVIFLVFVILLPMFVVDIMGQGAPYFCKLICPAGTLEGGLPLVLLNKSMRSAVGWLYIWKNAILVITIILSIIIYRPFCKYICPVGSLLLHFQLRIRISLQSRSQQVHSVWKMCKSLPDGSQPGGKTKQSGVYSLWEMPQSLSGGCDSMWYKKRIYYYK